MTRILSHEGFSVTEAATLAEAHRSLPADPAWILLDLMLPDGCGTEVIARVRAGRLPHRICVVTGCAPSAVARASRLGADHVFRKPLDVTRLLDVLRADVAAR